MKNTLLLNFIVCSKLNFTTILHIIYCFTYFADYFIILLILSSYCFIAVVLIILFISVYRELKIFPLICVAYSSKHFCTLLIFILHTLNIYFAFITIIFCLLHLIISYIILDLDILKVEKRFFRKFALLFCDFFAILFAFYHILHEKIRFQQSVRFDLLSFVAIFCKYQNRWK